MKVTLINLLFKHIYYNLYVFRNGKLRFNFDEEEDDFEDEFDMLNKEIDAAFTTDGKIHGPQDFLNIQSPEPSPFLKPNDSTTETFQRKGSRKLSFRKKKGEDGQPYSLKRGSMRRQASMNQ